tara:strand:+ start:576 stop:2594 length:2019 start_codon:yes stop_codon:yes gene_type:complete
MLVSRQFLPIFAISLLLASALVFVPVSAASSMNIDVEGDHNEYSFASVNGTASFVMTLQNDGDVDFDSVIIAASFDDPTWNDFVDDNVTFTYSGSNATGSIDLGTLAAGALAQVSVDVVVGYGAKVDMSNFVYMNLDVTADGQDYEVSDTVIVVSNWKAYQSEFPSSPVENTYDIGTNFSYQIMVENIAVEKLPGGGTQAVDIMDSITVQFGGLGGWTIYSDDPAWDSFQGGVLEGLTAGQIYTWDIRVELSSKVKAGSADLDFQAFSVDPNDPFGFPYYQPFGMISIPVSASEMFGIKLDGSGSRDVDLSKGASVADWTVRVNNLGNTDDDFTINWDAAGIPSGWNLNVDTSGPMVTDSISWSGFYQFEVVLSVPSDALADTTVTFSMSAFSNGDSTQTATQDFTATVSQHHGVSLSVDSESKENSPGQAVDFIFNITNTGNGQDTFSITVEGPAVWNPVLSQDNISVDAVSGSQFTLTVSIPSDKDAGANSGDIVVTVLSSDDESTANSTVSVTTSQVYDIGLGYVSGSNGTATVTQETQILLKLNVTNNGNGIDTLALAMANAPSWASLGAETMQIGRGQTQAITITLSPDAAALSGRDYTFQVVVTSADGSEYTSPDFSANIEVKQTTGGGEVEVEDIESDDDSSTPGFGLIASLLALTTLVVLRRRA